MPRVIVTGGPGAGKTTLLAELAAMGYATVDESARAIIAERLARGASPRPDPVAFAREIVHRDIRKYLNQPRSSEWVFFDRGLIEALGVLHEASPLSSFELASMLATYPFHAMVFVLPPWDAIYSTDAERDQSFAEAVEVHARVVQAVPFVRLCSQRGSPCFCRTASRARAANPGEEHSLTLAAPGVLRLAARPRARVSNVGPRSPAEMLAVADSDHPLLEELKARSSTTSETTRPSPGSGSLR